MTSTGAFGKNSLVAEPEAILAVCEPAGALSFLNLDLAWDIDEGSKSSSSSEISMISASEGMALFLER